jgi:hypothetical protein
MQVVKSLANDDQMLDCYFVAKRDLIGDTGLHSKFHSIKAGTHVFLVRTGKNALFCGFFDNTGKWFQYSNVPYIHYVRLLNRLFTIDGIPARALSDKIKKLGIVRFNGAKVAKLSEYTHRKTFPNTLGIVRTQEGKTYEDCVVVGDPDVNAKGLLYLMLDNSLVFVPNLN